ncbi:head-tail adaptor protein [Lactobacillus sakei] [Lactiplantibacillus mudanjiangensis]|uniref:phage head completion protein n=1 Tax=Lactiplantibacillus mudanjiangensis TaxID=1296538 RepID=UPI001013E60E|nr:head-tail adaptor protein [Lactobacillus sakei] [Lactiplantibacillus mudanjiangensis]
MSLTDTGRLTVHLKIVTPGQSTKDEFNDETKVPDQVIASPWAMERTISANEKSENPIELRNVTQFVIRHRPNFLPAITTDMQVIQTIGVKKFRYEITDYNRDSQYGNWDVIICERVVNDNG